MMCVFLPNNSFNILQRKTAFSKLSANARVFAAVVLFASHLIFFDAYMTKQLLISSPRKNIKCPHALDMDDYRHSNLIVNFYKKHSHKK